MITTLILPFQREHMYLTKVSNGESNLILDKEKASGIYSDQDSLEFIAQDLYEATRDSQGSLAELVEVIPPAFLNQNLCVIEIILSEQGRHLLGLLGGGWLVDRNKKEADLEATIKFYDKMLNKGAIREDYARIIIANKDARLRDLRSRLTLFRLTGKSNTGFFHGMEQDD